MTDLIEYRFHDHKIRTIIDENGETWWVAKDVYSFFGHSDYRRSIIKLDDDEKGVAQTDTPGGKQLMSTVNESGLYSLLFQIQPQKANIPMDVISKRLEQIRSFKRWVTHEVLPSIRKTGAYSARDPKVLIATALIEANKIIESQRPKIEAYDTFIDAKGLYTIAQVAKTIGTGQKRLFNFLRENEILMSNNQPYQRYMDQGYFETKWKTLPTGFDYSQTFVTPKGIVFISRLQKERKNELSNGSRSS